MGIIVSMRNTIGVFCSSWSKGITWKDERFCVESIPRVCASAKIDAIYAEDSDACIIYQCIVSVVRSQKSIRVVATLICVCFEIIMRDIIKQVDGDLMN